MAQTSNGGIVLTLNDEIDEVAIRLGELWVRYNDERRRALLLGEEARQFIYATDIDSTSARDLPHKNRTHQPKLTEIADTLKAEYYEATLSMPEFFRFRGDTPEGEAKAGLIAAYIRTKLEQKKFRETVGRQLITDYVDYGNSFATVDWVEERDAVGNLLFKGPMVSRVSPNDFVFNNRADSFRDAAKLQRCLVHVSKLAQWPEKYPTANFDAEAIDKAIMYRTDQYVDDWVNVIKERGLVMDGFNGYDHYFKQDLVEVIIYRGDIFNPSNGETKRNRIVYVVDRLHVIRDEENHTPSLFDGVHHAGWRIRPDNMWAQGPLDNLVGMQYRIDHLENLKADVFDQIAHPILKIKGDEVQEPDEGYAPGAVYYTGLDGDVEVLSPDTTALQSDNQIQLYHRLMESFAGAPPEERGIRTPGEKTAFEVQRLDQGASKLFLDKVRNFELMIERILQECFELTLLNFNQEDYIYYVDEETGFEDLAEIQLEDINARGRFVAEGARFWTRRNQESLELREFQTIAMQDPKLRMHMSGWEWAQVWKQKLNLKDTDVFQQFGGIKEDAAAQIIGQTEQQRLQQALQQQGQPSGLPLTGQTEDGIGPETLQFGRAGDEGNPESGQGQ